MMTSTAEIMDLGMNCLLEKLGTGKTEEARRLGASI